MNSNQSCGLFVGCESLVDPVMQQRPGPRSNVNLDRIAVQLHQFTARSCLALAH